jgi:hypothetical protein
MTTATKERIINKVENLSESDALMVLNFIDDIENHVPNEETVAVLRDIEAGRGLVGPFDDMKDFMESLLSDDDA